VPAAQSFIVLARLLHAECLPQFLQAGVELGDLFFHGRIEPLGERVPEVLALLGDTLDLVVDLIWRHAYGNE
jgi:hypothetical protein